MCCIWFCRKGNVWKLLKLAVPVSPTRRITAVSFHFSRQIPLNPLNLCVLDKNNATKCEHGVYVAANDSCLCFSGWKGHRWLLFFYCVIVFKRNFLSCESLCDEGYYGEGCLQKCDCPFCNSTNGECHTTTTTTESAIRTFGPPRLQKYHTFDATTTEKLAVTTPETTTIKAPSSTYQHEALTTTKHIPILPQIQKQDEFVFGVATAVGGGLLVLVLCVVLVVVRRFQKKIVGVAEARHNGGSTIGVKSNRERASSNGEWRARWLNVVMVAITQVVMCNRN